MKWPEREQLYRFATGLFAVTMILHLLTLLMYHNTLNHDVAQYITMARMIMNGAVPFRDIMDTNPPTIMYLSILPNVISDISGLDIVRSTAVSMLMLMFAVLMLVRISLKSLFGDSTAGLELLFAAAVMYTSTKLMLRNEFAQREHIMALLFLPYLVQRVVTASGKQMSWHWETIAGIMAVTALYMKPVYITVPLLIESFVLYSRYRTFDWSVVRHPLIIAGCGLIILLWPPMQVFVFEWSGVFSSYYKAYGYAPKKVLWNYLREPETHFILLLTITLLAMRHRFNSVAIRKLMLGVVLLAPAGIVGMLLQGKGWYYHKILDILGLYLLAAFVLYYGVQRDRKDEADSSRSVMLVTGTLLLLQIFMYPSLTSTIRVGPPKAPGNQLSALIERHTKPHESIASVSFSVGMQFPALTYTGRGYASRYYSAFPIVMAYAGQETLDPIEERRWLDQRFYENFCADIEANMPEMLTIENVYASHDTPENLSMKTYLKMKGFFEGPGSNYHYLTSIGGVVEIYLLGKHKGEDS